MAVVYIVTLMKASTTVDLLVLLWGKPQDLVFQIGR
jgi:hypothetical protein